MPKRGVSCYRPRSSSERPQIEVAPEGKALRRKSSTSWRHLKRILRRRDGQSAGCGAETNGQALSGGKATAERFTTHGQARVGRRKLAVLLDLAALVELLLLAAPVFLPLSFLRC